MRRSFVLAAVVSCVVFLGGCGGQTLDTSSQEAFKKSVEEVSKGLDAQKKDKFEMAVTTLMLHEMVFAGNIGDDASIKKKMDEVFGGKTVDEVIAAGEKVQAAAKSDIEKMSK